MTFLCTTIPEILPDWCQVEDSNPDGRFNCKLNVESEALQEELLQELGENAVEDLLERCGFKEIYWVPGKIRLISDCPLSPLNSLFPEGIPTVICGPSLKIRDELCWELDTQGLSKEIVKQIIKIAVTDNMPVDIILGLKLHSVLAIPQSWVVSIPATKT